MMPEKRYGRNYFFGRGGILIQKFLAWFSVVRGPGEKRVNPPSDQDSAALRHRFLPLLFVVCYSLFLLGSPLSAGAENDRLVKPEVAERINRAWKAYRNQKPNKAVRLIRPLTKREDLPADVYLLAGRIFYDKNRFDRAINQFNFALRKSNNPRYRESARHFIQRSRQLQNLDLSNRVYSQFIVLTSPELPKGVSSRVNQDLMKAYRRVGGDLDLFPDRKFTVVLYTESQFRRTIEAPLWSGGVFDGKIHIPYYSDTRDPYTVRSLYHEYSHALLYHMARNNLPLWFNEGFATFQEYRQSRSRFRYRRLPDNPPEENIRELGDISELFRNKNDRSEARLAYEYSYSFLKFLEERFGIISIKRIIQKTGETSSFEKAVESTLNRSLNSLRFSWENWLDGELR